MSKVRSSDALMEAIGRVRRTGNLSATTFFALPHQVDCWMSRGSLEYSASEHCVLVFRRTSDFLRVYHVATDRESLRAALSTLDCQDTFVADLVGKEEDTATATCYEQCGFVEHAVLIRMSRTAVNGAPLADCAQKAVFAEVKDVAAVSRFFCQLLDPLVDQIPDEEDLQTAAANGRLLIVRGAGKVGGVLMFETNGPATHLRYWYVDPSMRNLRVGAQLMAHFLHLSRASRRIVLWVKADNTNAIAKYEHYGFRQEALVDRIMVKRSGMDFRRLSEGSAASHAPERPVFEAPSKDELDI